MTSKHGKCEPIDTATDTRFVKQDKESRFKESADVGRLLTADRPSGSETVVQPKSTTKKAAITYSRRSFVSRLGLLCCALPLTTVAQQVRSL